MIKLKKLNGDQVVVNAELIEMVRATPDTVITLTTEKNLLVEETVEQVMEKVISYKKECFSLYPQN